MKSNKNGKKVTIIKTERVMNIKKVTRTTTTKMITKMQWTNLAESRDTTIYGVIARIIETVGTPKVETRTTATSKIETIVERERSHF